MRREDRWIQAKGTRGRTDEARAAYRRALALAADDDDDAERRLLERRLAQLEPVA